MLYEIVYISICIVIVLTMSIYITNKKLEIFTNQLNSKSYQGESGTLIKNYDSSISYHDKYNACNNCSCNTSDFEMVSNRGGNRL